MRADWPEALPPPRETLILALLCALCFFSFAWSAPLFDLDEGAFAQATLEMMASGNWLTTTLDGAPRYDKPPLSYWLQALCVQAFGAQEFAFRLPSLIAASAWVCALWAFVREQHLPRASAPEATFAAGLLASALMVGVIAHAATADALLNLWLALSFFELWRWLRTQRRAPLLRLYLWVGLGLFTKGPVAAVLPLLTGIAFCLAYGRTRELRAALLEWRGWLITLAVLSVWLLPLGLSGQLAFAWEFLVQHNLGRYTEPAEGHGGGFWFYLLWLPLVLLPATGLLPRTLRAARQWREDPLLGLALLWLGLTLLIFSFSSTKLPHYALYGCTPLLALFGRQALALKDRRVLLPGLVLVVVLASLPLWIGLIEVPTTRAFGHGILELARAQIDWRYTLCAVLALSVAIWAWFAPQALWQRLLGLGVAQGLIVWLALVPLLVGAQQMPVREAARIARDSGLYTVRYRTNLPSFSVYRGAVTPQRLPLPGELVFVRRDRIAKLRAAAPAGTYSTVYQRGGVALLLREADLAPSSSQISAREQAH